MVSRSSLIIFFFFFFPSFSRTLLYLRPFSLSLFSSSLFLIVFFSFLSLYVFKSSSCYEQSLTFKVCIASSMCYTHPGRCPKDEIIAANMWQLNHEVSNTPKILKSVHHWSHHVAQVCAAKKRVTNEHARNSENYEKLIVF